MPTTPNLPTRPPCFPKEWLDGSVELDVPPALLSARWDTDIYDTNGVQPNNIIRITDPFEVCFRVELSGDLWRCMCGTWCFELGFSPCGEGTGFNLSKRMGRDLHLRDWKGCDTQCIEYCVTVPPGTVTADDCSTMYEVCATFELRCCDKPGAILVGYEVLGPFQFYKP